MMDDLRLRAYLSNQMSGRPEHNFPWFRDVAEDLRKQGIWVLSPHEIMHGGNQHFNADFGHQDYVNADIASMMDQCNAVAIGPHWQNSEGSRREVSVALLAGWPIYKVVLKFPLFPSLGYKLELI